MKQGTTAIHDIQRGTYTPTAMGECRPSEADLKEHEEIVVWRDDDWKQLPIELTEHEKALLSIRAFIEAIGDELDKLEGLE